MKLEIKSKTYEFKWGIKAHRLMETNHDMDMEHIRQHIAKLNVLIPFSYYALECSLPKGEFLPFDEEEYTDFLDEKGEPFLVEIVTDYFNHVKKSLGWEEIEEQAIEKLDAKKKVVKKKP